MDLLGGVGWLQVGFHDTRPVLEVDLKQLADRDLSTRKNVARLDIPRA